MFQLPVSGLVVNARAATGAEDLLLQEAVSLDAALALALIGRLVYAVDGSKPDWARLPFADIEALLLLLRVAVLGDQVRASVVCTASAECVAKVDISFRIGDYVSSQRPRIAKNIERTETPGWLGLSGETVRFRLPTGVDLLAVRGEPSPYAALASRCIEPADASPCVRAKVETAMEKMAPRLSQQMMGTCPECHAGIRFYFDVQLFVLQELRNRAAGVYQDVHLLAFHYKWSEKQILDLPGARRAQYAKLLREQGAAA